MRKHELIVRYTSKGEKPTFLVSLYEQPFHRWLIGRLYHAYEKLWWRVPGRKKFEGWHYRKFHDGTWTYVPLSTKREIKCFHLKKKGKVQITEHEIDHATYLKLGGPDLKY